MRHYRVDEEHSNVFAGWRNLGGDERDWPDSEDEWGQLRAGDELVEFEPARVETIGDDGQLTLTFRLPQPGISYLSVVPR